MENQNLDSLVLISMTLIALSFVYAIVWMLKEIKKAIKEQDQIKEDESGDN